MYNGTCVYRPAKPHRRKTSQLFFKPKWVLSSQNLLKALSKHYLILLNVATKPFAISLFSSCKDRGMGKWKGIAREGLGCCPDPCALRRPGKSSSHTVSKHENSVNRNYKVLPVFEETVVTVMPSVRPAGDTEIVLPISALHEFSHRSSREFRTSFQSSKTWDSF